jgi:hypothetical protein
MAAGAASFPQRRSKRKISHKNVAGFGTSPLLVSSTSSTLKGTHRQRKAVHRLPSLSDSAPFCPAAPELGGTSRHPHRRKRSIDSSAFPPDNVEYCHGGNQFGGNGTWRTENCPDLADGPLNLEVVLASTYHNPLTKRPVPKGRHLPRLVEEARQGQVTTGALTVAPFSTPSSRSSFRSELALVPHTDRDSVVSELTEPQVLAPPYRGGLSALEAELAHAVEARIPNAAAREVYFSKCDGIIVDGSRAFIRARRLVQQRRMAAAQEDKSQRYWRQNHRRRGSFLLKSVSEMRAEEGALMSLEDVLALQIHRVERAQMGRQDYASYYSSALRYHPLGDIEFASAVFPGRRLTGKLVEAAVIIQAWWWLTWPPFLRQMKRAALKIQAQWRRYIAVSRWRPIILLRVRMGPRSTMSAAWRAWRHFARRCAKVRAMTRRIMHRTATNAFLVWRDWAGDAATKRKDIVGRGMRRIVLGIRLRCFDSWVAYTEKESKIRLMGMRMVKTRMWRLWEAYLVRSRARKMGYRAASTLAARYLRWRDRGRWLRARRGLKRLKILTRGKRSRILARSLRQEALRIHSEMLAQEWADEEIRKLIEAENNRREALRDIMEDAELGLRGNAEAACRSSGLIGLLGRTGIRGLKDFERKRAQEAQFVKDHFTCGKFAVQHNFEAENPPPFRCAIPSCDCTFILLSHCEKHVCKLGGSPPLSRLSALLQDPEGLIAAQTYIGQVYGGSSEPYIILRLWQSLQMLRNLRCGSSEYEEAAQSILEMYFATSGERSDGEEQDLAADEVGSHSAATSVVYSVPLAVTTLSFPGARILEPFQVANLQLGATKLLLEHLGEQFQSSTTFLRYRDGKMEEWQSKLARAEEIVMANAKHTALQYAREVKAALIVAGGEAMQLKAAEEATSSAVTMLEDELIDEAVGWTALILMAERKVASKVVSSLLTDAVSEVASDIAAEQEPPPPKEVDLVSEGVAFALILPTSLFLIEEAATLIAAEEKRSHDAATRDELGERGNLSKSSHLAEHTDRLCETALLRATHSTLEELWSEALDHATELMPAPVSSSAPVVVLKGSKERQHSQRKIGEEALVLSETAAAIRIQAAFRRKLVYKVVKSAVAQNYIKVYDPSTQYFYWYNQATGESVSDLCIPLDLKPLSDRPSCCRRHGKSL